MDALRTSVPQRNAVPVSLLRYSAILRTRLGFIKNGQFDLTRQLIKGQIQHDKECIDEAQ
ncbi:hypothetical protein BJX70DRAFT_355193 [Aspergillus crustosus]